MTGTVVAAEPSWVDRMLIRLGSSETFDTSEGMDWGVLPGPFANPELGFGLGVAAIGLYQTQEAPSKSDPLSTLSLTGFVSSTEAYGIGLENRTYLWGDAVRLLLDGGISDAPTHYWGVGYTAGKDSRNKRLHEGFQFRLSPKIATQFLPNWFVLGGWDATWLTNQSLDANDHLPHQDLPNQHSNGVLIGIEWDKRDFEPNPQAGPFFSLQWTGFRRAFGSDSDFDRWTANWRQYHTLDPKNIVAWELYGQALTGEVPWYAMSSLGGGDRMRGYYEGRYRDKTQLSMQVEWRRQFTHRHGMVLWGGMGAISEDVSALRSAHWLPTVGVGYRFQFKPRINVRFDFGIGQGSTGFYFQINEAF